MRRTKLRCVKFRRRPLLPTLGQPCVSEIGRPTRELEIGGRPHSSLAPVFLGLALHCRRLRVFDLHPTVRPVTALTCRSCRSDWPEPVSASHRQGRANNRSPNTRAHNHMRAPRLQASDGSAPRRLSAKVCVCRTAPESRNRQLPRNQKQEQRSRSRSRSDDACNDAIHSHPLTRSLLKRPERLPRE